MNTLEPESETPKAIIDRLFEEILNGKNLAIVGQFFSPDFRGPAGVGPEGFRIGMAPLFAGFPDLQFEIQDTLEAGTRVVVRWIWSGTHLGVFAGRPPTGREVSCEGISIYTVEGGRIVQTSAQMDRLGVLQQIGASPSGSAPASPATASRDSGKNLQQ